MPEINIDDLVEPIKVTVGGKTYTIADISPEMADEMAKISKDAEIAEKAAKKAVEAGEDPALANPNNTKAMMAIMTKMLGATKEAMAKLGMRKRLMLMKLVMETINEEIEGKNAPKDAAAK